MIQLLARIGLDDITVAAKLSPAGVVSLLQVDHRMRTQHWAKTLHQSGPCSDARLDHASEEGRFLSCEPSVMALWSRRDAFYSLGWV